jgi:hypothetical protein
MVLGLLACSNGPSYPKETAEAYFGAIASRDPEATISAAEYAKPGSDAEAYAIEQAAHTQAMLDGGTLGNTPQEVVLEADEVQLCVAGYDEPGVDRADYCSIYSELVFEGEKLVTFDAGGEPLEGRIALGDEQITPIGSIGSAEYLASYITIAGELVVVMEISSSIDTLGLPYNAAYIAPNGRQVEVSFVDGPTELRQGRVGNVAYSFAGAAFGGELELEFYDADFNEIVITVPTT